MLNRRVYKKGSEGSNPSLSAKYINECGKMLKQFTIDEQYICDVVVRTETAMLENPDDPTPNDLIRIIKGHHKIVSISNKDHDEFTKLRNQLEELGYIKTERSWWNGDRVLKGFRLNEFCFKKGDKFACAGAMKGAISYARQYKRKNIGF